MSGQPFGRCWCRGGIAALAFCLLAVLLHQPAFAESDPIRVQLRWLHQFQFAGYYAALELGYYREAGLEVTLVEGGPGRNPIEEVVSGRAQYGAAASEVLLAHLRGQPVKILAVIFQQSPSVFLARKASGINSPQDMLGQRVMMLPGFDDAELLAMFMKEGVKLEKIHRLPTSYNIEDLILGKTDAFNAYLTNEPYYLESRGVPTTIIRPSTYGIHFYGDSVFTSEREVKDHPERVKAFLQATLRGWQYAMDHPEEIIELILARYHPLKTREHLRYEAATMRELMQPHMIQIGHMNPGRWRHMAETFAELGLVDKDFDLKGLIYDPRAARDITPILWGAGIAVGGFLVVGAVALALAGFNRRLRREVQERTRAEQRLAAMVANVPGVIFQMHIDPSGRRQYTYLSPRAAEFFGMGPEDVVREGALLPWHPEERERVDAEIAAARDTGGSLNLVGRILLPDGELKWVRLTASSSPQENGTSLVTGFILDITKRKLAETEYLANERKIKAMSQAVDDALIMVDSLGKVLFWNPAAERLFGYTAAEAMGMDFHSMAAPDEYRDKIRQGLAEFNRHGRGPVLGTTTEVQARDRHGRVFPVEVTLSAFQVDEEWYAVGTVRDISARKQAEALMVAKEVAEEAAARAELARQEAEAARAQIEVYKGRLELLVEERTEELRASEERSRLLLHSVGEGIFGVDAGGNFTFINPAALAMLGYQEAELMGRPVHAIIHHSRPDGSAYPLENCPMHSAFVQGVAHHVEDDVLWRKDGSSFPVEYTSTPIDQGDRIMGAVITFRDISGRRRAEEELRQYVSDLERFNQLTLGREERMIELKQEINGLLEKMGRARKYRIAEETAPQ